MDEKNQGNERLSQQEEVLARIGGLIVLQPSSNYLELKQELPTSKALVLVKTLFLDKGRLELLNLGKNHLGQLFLVLRSSEEAHLNKQFFMKKGLAQSFLLDQKGQLLLSQQNYEKKTYSPALNSYYDILVSGDQQAGYKSMTVTLFNQTLQKTGEKVIDLRQVQSLEKFFIHSREGLLYVKGKFRKEWAKNFHKHRPSAGTEDFWAKFSVSS